MKTIAFAAMALVAVTASACADDEISIVLDTGSHTCTRPGQETRVERTLSATPDRYFDKDSVRLEPISNFGDGKCEIFRVDEKKIEATLQSGKKVQLSVPVAYHAYAIADCTSNIAKIGSRIGRECKLIGRTVRID